MSEIKFTKTFKKNNNSRFENEKKIYELIKERKEFLSIEQNIIKEIDQKEKEKIIKNEEDKKEYRKMFCDLKPFNYILDYKGYESNKISDMPEIYLEKGVCDLNVFVKMFHQNFTFPQIRYIIYQILKGVNCLHNLCYDKNIFHNDLKGENVFVIIKDEEKRKLLEDIIKKFIENKGIKKPEINKEEFEKLNEEKSKTIFNNYTPSKINLFKKISCLTSGDLSRNNSGIKKSFFDDNELIKEQKNFEKDLLERRNIKFYHRYKNCLNTLKKEKVKHINNRIFDKQSIDSIMKSRNDLEIDKLKYDYTKIGTIEAINKTAFSRQKMLIDLKEKKEKAMNKVNNKIQTAIFNHDIGKISSKTYNLEDYIKL